MTSQENRPLAAAVMAEEMDAIARQFDRLRESEDVGERGALLDDLLRSVDRYLRLESEVLFPAVRRAEIDVSDALERHAGIRAALGRAGDPAAQADTLQRLERALEAHREAQAATVPEATRRLGAEAEGLAYELDEARGRMRGTYGV